MDRRVTEWIRAGRRRLNLSQAALAQRANVAQTTISKWELGKSEPSYAELARLEVIFGTKNPLGARLGAAVEPAMVPVMGYVGANQAIDVLAANALEAIEAPPGAPVGAQCVIVRGASLPPFKPGSALLFWAWSSDPAAFLGELCPVELQDGSLFAREIGRGRTPGLWTLKAAFGNGKLRDVAVARVALIEMMWRPADLDCPQL